jgi:putative transposase
MMYVRYPLSLRQVEDLLHERSIDICYETVRAWWNQFGPLFAAEIRKTRSASQQGSPQWRWHLDEFSFGSMVKYTISGVRSARTK